jgi:beta-sarcoglycan
MTKEGIEVRGTNLFIVRDHKTNLPIFTTSTSKQKFMLEKPAQSLVATSIESSEVVSPVEDKLKIQGQKLIIRGIEGTTIDSKETLFTADGNIFLKSSNGSIKLDAQNGTYIDIKSLKIVENTTNGNDYHFVLCVCYPKGALYRVKTNKTKGELCKDYNREHFDPCT